MSTLLSCFFAIPRPAAEIASSQTSPVRSVRHTIEVRAGDAVRDAERGWEVFARGREANRRRSLARERTRPGRQELLV
jgi:Ni/Co efflux regulator RcnB